MVVEPVRCETVPGSDRLHGLAQGRVEGDDAVDVPGRVPQAMPGQEGAADQDQPVRRTPGGECRGHLCQVSADAVPVENAVRHRRMPGPSRARTRPVRGPAPFSCGGVAARRAATIAGVPGADHSDFRRGDRFVHAGRGRRASSASLSAMPASSASIMAEPDGSGRGSRASGSSSGCCASTSSAPRNRVQSGVSSRAVRCHASLRPARVVLDRERTGVAGRRRVLSTASSPAAARTFRSVLQPGSTRPASMRVTVVGEMPAISARARTDKPAAVRARLTASLGSSTV